MRLKFDLDAVGANDKVTLTAGTLDIGALNFNEFTFSNVGGLAAGVYTLFDATTANNISGSIGTASGSIGAFSGALSIDGTSKLLQLTVTGTGPANNSDFNSDGIVDGTDFLTWQRGLGLTGQTGKTNGNANADTVVDGADLAVLRTHFGGPGATGALGSVPEPASYVLGIASVLALLRWRRC